MTASAVTWRCGRCWTRPSPANGGALRPVEVVAPAGTIVAATFPAAVGAGNVEVSQRVADVCLGRSPRWCPTGAGRVPGHDEQPPAGRRGLGLLLRDHRWRPGRAAASPWRGPSGAGHDAACHGDDPTPATPRWRRSSAPSPCACSGTSSGGGAAVPGGAGRRGHRARPAPARGRDVSLITERRVSPPWAWPGANRGPWGRTGCCPVATRPGRAPGGQVHRPAPGWRRPAHGDPGRRRVGAGPRVVGGGGAAAAGHRYRLAGTGRPGREVRAW